MVILLLAVLAFVVMRLIPRLKSAGHLKLMILAIPCAVGAWLLLSLITNVARHAN